MSNLTAQKLFGAASIPILFSFALAGCVHQSTDITFIVPQGFRGEIRIWEEPDSPHAATRGENTLTLRTFTLQIPASGELPLQETDLFFRWHTPILQFEGSDTVSRSDTAPTSPEEIKLFSSGSVAYDDGPQIHVFFVGTLEEFLASKRR